jgi:hypothetical protein
VGRDEIGVEVAKFAEVVYAARAAYHALADGIAVCPWSTAPQWLRDSSIAEMRGELSSGIPEREKASRVDTLARSVLLALVIAVRGGR